MTLKQTMPAAPVRLLNITKRFGKDVVAVDDITLNIEPGTLVTLLGPSGCGKTTTLRMIAGLERATEGTIEIDGETVTKLPANLRDVTMVFQSYALFPHMNVFENVAYGLRVAKRPSEEIEKRVDEALELVGLAGYGERKTNALSGGQQQRVALARALVMQPKVLLFDEPLSNLDAKLRRRVRAEIRDLQQRLGITSVYVTHDQEEALAISDVIVTMNQGGIEQIGAPRELYSQPTNKFVADFIGSASFLPGSYDGTEVRVGNYTFAHRQDIPPGDVTVMVRPEAVEFEERVESQAEAERPASAEGLEATVWSVSYLGVATDIILETPAGELSATVTGEGWSDLKKGDTTRVTFRRAGVYLLPDTEGGDT